MKKSRIIMAFLIIGITTQLGCTNTSEDQEENVVVETVKTDTESLKEVFPNLEGIESTEWEYELMTIEGRAPGPSDYCYRGIIVLDNDTAEKYWNNYEWTEVNKELEAEYIDLSKYANKTWYVSNKMKTDMMSIGYMGDVYFAENYIWFDVITQ